MTEKCPECNNKGWFYDINELHPCDGYKMATRYPCKNKFHIIETKECPECKNEGWVYGSIGEMPSCDGTKTKEKYSCKNAFHKQEMDKLSDKFVENILPNTHAFSKLSNEMKCAPELSTKIINENFWELLGGKYDRELDKFIKTNTELNKVDMAKENPIALFDMDGSLFNYDEALIRDLNKLRSPNEPEIDESNLWELEKNQYLKERMNLIKSQSGWWFNLSPIKEGFDVLHSAISIGYTCQILTKGPFLHSNAWREKYDCIRKHFGNDIEIHITQNKSQIYGNLLYDDYPQYMESWLKYRPRGLGIMPIKKYNAHYTHSNVVRHGSNTKEIIEIMKKFYENRNVELAIRPDRYRVQCCSMSRDAGRKKINEYYFQTLDLAEKFVENYNQAMDYEVVVSNYLFADQPELISN